MLPNTSSLGGFGPDSAGKDPIAGERGYRRRRLAAMANNMYRAGATAVNEIKESYAQTRVRDMEGPEGMAHIPGAFPDVAITVQGDDQMVIFPSYAKRHHKRRHRDRPAQSHDPTTGAIKDEEFWRQEWERHEDEKAIVDIDVRGWVYSPHKGPMTRRNRILLGLARQLSGIPRPDLAHNPGHLGADHETHEERRERERIAQEAARIERKGREEKKVASQGGYSENPKDDSDGEFEGADLRSRSGSQTPHSPRSPPLSPALSARTVNTAGGTVAADLTEAELAVANINLMARIAPFMTTPRAQIAITIFFYNDETSQSRTVTTDDAGHFSIRAALDFVPTHIRVLANESLSAVQEVKIIEPRGVSLISDIDDTVKRSNISAGAKEIFRNTFVRNLEGLTVEGVKEWYGELQRLGVSFHYCSNSPWQLFPVLASYFLVAGLPPGSLHLKQYSGMLQGIFEPVAERKKSTLTRLMRDFPERKFLLVGDSGEADLEVYTELALAHPGRILAVFIRDVTTPPDEPSFFDQSFGASVTAPAAGKKSPSIRFAPPDSPDEPERRPVLPPRGGAGAGHKTSAESGPAMGTLIDFSDEPEEAKLDQVAALAQLRQQQRPTRSVSASDLLGKVAPPRPAKPPALRGAPSDVQGLVGLGISGDDKGAGTTPPPPPPPRPRVSSGPSVLGERPAQHPLTRVKNSERTIVPDNKVGAQAPPPPPRRRGTPSSILSLSPRMLAQRRGTSNSDVDYEPLPPASAPVPGAAATAGASGLSALARSRSGGTPTRSRSGGSTPTVGSPTLGPVNKRLETWRRRLQHAQELLEAQGVRLYTWRTGNDVVKEAAGIVQEAMAEFERAERR